MLFVDDKKVSRQELARMFGIKDLSKIDKNPIFELHKSQVKKDRFNLNAPRVGKGIQLRPKFRATKPGTTEKVEVRYAESSAPEKGSNGAIISYKPRYILIEGSVFKFTHNKELALFLYLHPGNVYSPCREPGGKYTDYFEYVDTQARAVQRLKIIQDKTKALRHAEQSDIFDLRLVAKSLDIPKADTMDDDTLRVTMMEYADNPITTKKYADAIESRTTLYDGRIVNLIDNGYLVVERIGNYRQWKWAKGLRSGESVGEPIIDAKFDAKKYIRNYLLSNLSIYEPEIVQTNDELLARMKAEAHLSSLASQSDDNEEVYSNEEIPLPNWENLNEVKEFVYEKGYNRSPEKIKMLRDAALNGHINAENVDVFLDQNFNKREDS